MARSNRAATSKVWEVRLGLEVAYRPCSLCVVDDGLDASNVSRTTLSSICRDHVLAMPFFHFTTHAILDRRTKGIYRTMCVLVVEELKWSED